MTDSTVIRAGSSLALLTAVVLALLAWLDPPLSPAASGSPVGPPLPGTLATPEPGLAAGTQRPAVPTPDVPATTPLDASDDGTNLSFRCSEPLRYEPRPTLVARPVSEHLGSRPQSTRLEPDGSARLALVPGRWQLTLAGPLGELSLGSLDIVAGANTLACDLQQLPGVVVRVVDQAARPIEGASVWLGIQRSVPVGQREQLGPGTLQVRRTTTPTDGSLAAISDADGVAFFGALPAGQRLFAAARRDGFLEATRRDLALGPDAPTRVDSLVLAAGRRVTGQVVDAAGLPVAGCQVDVLVDGRPHSTASSDDGRFAFASLPAGAGTVWTLDPAAVNDGARLPEMGDVDVRLVLRDGAFVEGVVRRADSTPVPGVRVSALAVGEGDADLGQRRFGLRSSLSDAEGRFRLGPFAPGVVRVSEATHSHFEALVQVPGRQDIVLPEPLRWDLRLSFVARETGAPVVSQGTLVVHWGDASQWASGTERAVEPDTAGAWSLRQETPPDVAVWCELRMQGFAPITKLALDPALAAGGSLTVELERDFGITVAVTDAAGPVRGAVVALIVPVTLDGVRGRPAWTLVPMDESPTAGQLAAASHGVTDADGHVRFERLGDGPVLWRVQAAGHLAAGGRLEQLPPGPRAKGAGGHPLADLQVQLQLAETDH